MMRSALGAVLLVASAVASAQRPVQTDADHYTRYELLAPSSAKFRIIYEVTATTPGATRYFNPIRRGSVATDEAVYDRMGGEKLRFEVVSGRVAREWGLPRPIPPASTSWCICHAQFRGTVKCDF